MSDQQNKDHDGMSNPFQRLAEQQISNPVKSRMKAAITREQRRRAKQLSDDAILFKQWKEWHQKCKAELLVGPYGEAASELADFIEHMSIRDGDALITKVERGPWVSADTDSRYQVLRMIDHSIVYLRESNGLEPFDDPLDDDLNVFLQIRQMLSPS